MPLLIFVIILGGVGAAVFDILMAISMRIPPLPGHKQRTAHEAKQYQAKLDYERSEKLRRRDERIKLRSLGLIK